MTLEEAAEKGIKRLYSPELEGLFYIRLDIRKESESLGSWLRLFTPECTILELEYPNPVLSMLDLGVAPDSWKEFTGHRSAFDRDGDCNYMPLSE